ncbi:MAG: methyl-accepting chemotaxis protein [Allorhizobium sp.]
MKLKVATKLIGVFVLMLALTAGLGIYATTSLTSIEAATSGIVDKRVPAFILLGQMNADLGDVRIAQGAVLNAPVDNKAAFEQTLNQTTTKLLEDMDKYKPLLVDQADKDLFASITSSWSDYAKTWEKVTTLAAGNVADANALFFGDALKVYNAAGTALQRAVDDIAADTKNAGEETAHTVSQASLITYIAVGLALLIGIGAALFANINIARPIVQITAAMRALAGGDTDSSIPYAGRQDEIGAMAAATEVFRKGATDNKRMEIEAGENRKQAEANRISDQRRAEDEAAARMRIATTGLATGLKRLAGGDLSFQLDEAFSEDFEGLRQDFNLSVTQLATSLRSVSDSIGSITNGSQEISSGTNDLSRRTEQQAAALEQTAAALDQITVNVQSSSKLSEEARTVATQANTSATESGLVVGKAVEAMSRIEQSSSQISNIIGVIDEIAFQTNLLALNAGVEAARAGEAGKGFAVVAQEVRELAQRSAQAAKEIKALIHTSSTEVSVGVKLVSETGTALKSIGDFVATINQHMQAIATSAREQSTGLAEVNTAVNQMDQTTQQNAAMVEESSAAASTLANEANTLRNVISQFNVGNASGQAEALRQSATRMARPAAAAASVQQPRPQARKTATGGAATQEWSEF